MYIDVKQLETGYIVYKLPKTVTGARQVEDTMVYPKVSGLAAWSGNCKWYSSLPVDAVVLLFC
jgi:hypothetical protein